VFNLLSAIRLSVAAAQNTILLFAVSNANPILPKREDDVCGGERTKDERLVDELNRKGKL